MPITFHYERNSNILFETGTGEITIEEFLAYREKLEAVGMESDFRCLANYLDAIVDVSFEDMQMAAKHSKNIVADMGEVRLAYTLQMGSWTTLPGEPVVLV